MEIIQEIGAYAGLAAVVGLAVLSALYFSQARDVRRLREWAGRAPERTAGQQVRPPTVAQPPVSPPAPAKPAVRPPPPVARPAPAAAAGAASAASKPGAATPAGKQAVPAVVGTAGAVAAQASAPSASARGSAPAAATDPKAEGASAPAAAPTAPVDAPDASGDTGERPAKAPALAGGPPAPSTNAKADAPPEMPASEEAAAPPREEAAAAATGGEPRAVAPEAAASPSLDAQAPAGAAEEGQKDPPGPPSVGTTGTVRPLPSPATAPRPAPAGTAVLPPYPATARRRWYRRAFADPRYVVLAVAGVLIVGAGAAFGISELAKEEAPPAREESPAPAGASGGAESKPQAPVSPGRVTVAVLNGTTVPGLAAQIGDRIEARGFQLGNITNSTDQQRNESVVLYAPGHEREATVVGRRLGIPQREPIDPESQALGGDAAVVVIAGADQTR